MLFRSYWCPTCQAPAKDAVLTEVTPTGLVRPKLIDAEQQAAADYLAERDQRWSRSGQLSPTDLPDRDPGHSGTSTLSARLFGRH